MEDGAIYAFGEGPSVILDHEEGFVICEWTGDTDREKHVIVAKLDPDDPRTLLCRFALAKECEWLPNEED